MKKLYESMAKCQALRAHAEECNRAISRRAGEWLPAADDAFARMNATEAEALDPKYNAVGALNLARGRDLMRKLRDGY